MGHQYFERLTHSSVRKFRIALSQSGNSLASDEVLSMLAKATHDRAASLHVAGDIKRITRTLQELSVNETAPREAKLLDASRSITFQNLRESAEYSDEAERIALRVLDCFDKGVPTSRAQIQAKVLEETCRFCAEQIVRSELVLYSLQREESVPEDVAGALLSSAANKAYVRLTRSLAKNPNARMRRDLRSPRRSRRQSNEEVGGTDVG